MSTTALTNIDRMDRPLTANDIRAQVNIIQEVMKAVMKQDIHYGIIPGCDKPSLWKAGAEKILSTFRIAIEPIVEDLSTADEARFRVSTKATSMPTGLFLGSGIGEASSSEDKYKWRATICDEEWDELNKKGLARLKWKRGKDKPYTIRQVRANIADVANTVLKMAKKRSMVDVTLTVTAASDCFTQDIEDLPEEYMDAVDREDQREELPPEIKRKSEAPKPQAAPEQKQAPVPPPPPRQAPAPQQQAKAQQPAEKPRHGQPTITEPQAKRFYAIWKGAGRSPEEVKQYLLDEFNCDRSFDIPSARYEEACKWAGGQ